MSTINVNASFRSIMYEKWRHRFPAGHIRTLHSLAKMWTFGAFFLTSLVFVCFPLALWTALDIVVCVGRGSWFDIKGHVLMCCFSSEHSILCSSGGSNYFTGLVKIVKSSLTITVTLTKKKDYASVLLVYFF